MLNKAKDYYKNNKDGLREQPRDEYRNLSEEGENKKREYGKNRYRNMSEEKNKDEKNLKKIITRQKKVSI